ncbi:unnamed protein product [Staurois parvus]|uniref:Uncharacterized protein n=1 Tax=Staurois parvus TaxID=386267 RepID=A0ABN9AHJ9_9NEOB|nr:unnamed protein product [Staurois parvus]
MVSPPLEQTVHPFEWTPVRRGTQGRIPCSSSENTAHTGTTVPSTVAFSSADGVPLVLMAPACGSAFLCVGGAAA